MKILFSNPPWFAGDREGIRAGSRWPHTRPRSSGGYYPYPFYLGYATSYLRAKGYDAVMRDSILLREDNESYYAYIKQNKFDYIFIETGSPCWDHDRELIHKLLSEHKVVLVGPHATVFAESLFDAEPYFAVIKGEYEKNALKVVEMGAIISPLGIAEIQRAASEHVRAPGEYRTAPGRIGSQHW